jgi:phosphoribosylformylglycinamidine synthase
MQAVRDAHEAVRIGVNLGALHSAHDISEGGLAVAVAESCIAGRIGARVRIPHGLAPFAEASGRAFVVSGPEDALTGFQIIGTVGGDELELDGLLKIAVSDLHAAHEHGLSEYV